MCFAGVQGPFASDGICEWVLAELGDLPGNELISSLDSKEQMRATDRTKWWDKVESDTEPVQHVTAAADVPSKEHGHLPLEISLWLHRTYVLSL